MKPESKLRQVMEKEDVGAMAGVVHNLNNLLTAIQGTIYLMLLDVNPTHPHYEHLTELKCQVRDGARFATQLLGYAGEGGYQIQSVDLSNLAKKTCEALGETRRDILIQAELAEGLSDIKGDRSQIQQVLLNLLINAADAMPEGGDLIVKTARVSYTDITDKPYNPKPGNYVELTVADTGKGMDKETMDRIFDPFFTTKEMGHGTGLGLASVYGAVKGHGGYIDVESEASRGTTFTVYLPAFEERIENNPAHPSEKIIKGNRTILLVDDEKSVLGIASAMLKKLGYTVIEADRGHKALEFYRVNKDTIDIVILDMLLPDIEGGVVYDKMKEINPNVKVILSSGYGIEGEPKEILARGCDAFIQKPFDLSELSQKLREVLDRK